MNSKTTSQKILEAAVRLYGERGADAVGMRELARAVKVMPNTITYHFGSKENLRRQALALALEQAASLKDILELHPPVESQDPQEQANQIQTVLVEYCKKIFEAQSESSAKMITYGMIGADAEQKKVLFEALKRVEKDLLNYLGALGLAPDESPFRFFIYNLWSQTLFLASAQDMIRLDLGTDSLPPDFLDGYAREVARTCCLLVRLPEPAALPES